MNKERISKKAVNSSFEPRDPIFDCDKTITPGVATKLKLSWLPHYKGVEQMSPVNYFIRNYVTGCSKVVHAENLQHATPDHVWDIPRDKPEYVTP